MNRLTMRFHNSKVQEPIIIEVSSGFEKDLIDLLVQITSLEIDLMKADRVEYNDGELSMVRYTLDLSQEKADEIGHIAQEMYQYFFLRGFTANPN